VIDVGKNFQAAAVEWFPKYGLRTIDAVLITHAHADGLSTSSDHAKTILVTYLIGFGIPAAVNGLDDLRGEMSTSSLSFGWLCF
jgi:L-ascorbate metabolism protein UlaG (beta-lactamase superfamily)